MTRRLLRRAVFTFGRHRSGAWQDYDGHIAALDGDPVRRWDDPAEDAILLGRYRVDEPQWKTDSRRLFDAVDADAAGSLGFGALSMAPAADAFFRIFGMRRVVAG